MPGQSPSDRIIEIEYGELLGDPARTLSRISSFIGVAVERRTLTRSAKTVSAQSARLASAITERERAIVGSQMSTYL